MDKIIDIAIVSLVVGVHVVISIVAIWLLFLE